MVAGVRCGIRDELLPVASPARSAVSSQEDDAKCGTSKSISTCDVGSEDDYESVPLSERSASFCEYMAKHPEAVVIGIRGNWYDVTSFRHRHPGGAFLLEQMHGKDCTDVYEAFHRKDHVKFFPKVGSFKVGSSEISRRFRALNEEFRRQGFFDTSYAWYAAKFAFVFALVFASFAIILGASAVSPARAAAAGVFAGLFWQQCGFIMHDAMHTDVTHHRLTDRLIGLLFGSLLLGIPAHWWRDEHFEHHAFTNVVDPSTLYADPQMVEEVWLQDRLLFPTTAGPRPAWKRKGQQLFFRVQGWAWIALAMLLGRVAIAVDAMHVERRWYEWVAFGVHNGCLFGWMYHSQRFTLLSAFCFWYTAAVIEGLLHVQLLVNHYAKPWTRMPEVCENVSWAQLQTFNTLNIRTPWWFDWFYGGLNYHIEHHLFPKMPRHNFSKAKPRVMQFCRDCGLPYDEEGFMESILTCSWKLHGLAKEFRDWWGGPAWTEWQNWFARQENNDKNNKLK